MKIFCTSTGPNYGMPWQMLRQHSHNSSGFILSGHRIMVRRRFRRLLFGVCCRKMVDPDMLSQGNAHGVTNAVPAMHKNRQRLSVSMSSLWRACVVRSPPFAFVAMEITKNTRHELS